MSTYDLQGSATVFAGSPLGTALTDLLMCSEIQPGSLPSYQMCRTLYVTHPIGKKLVDAPLWMAQSQARELTIPAAPEDRVRDVFLKEWVALGCDRKIEQLARISRVYGLGAFGVVQDGVDPNTPLDFRNLWKQKIAINVLDPLNTSGSIGVMNQDPNSATFQAVPQIVVSGRAYHQSRSFVLLNEMPIYIDYTSSAFGYYGRSVYQRALYPLKTFVQTMRTDDLVTRKVGVIIAKVKQLTGIVDNAVAMVIGAKRQLAKQAITDDVLSIGIEDDIASMNLQNLEAPAIMARRNCIENIATAADMPAIILNSETYAEGFGEGTEDAKKVASFVDGVRLWMNPAYDFLDAIVMYRAWTPDFYATIQAEFPEEYGGVDFDAAFAAWKNSFRAAWPSLVTEPESKKVEVDKVRFESMVALAELMLPVVDPANKIRVVQWMTDNANEQKMLFSMPLELDLDSLEEFVEQQAEAAARLQEAGTQAAEEGVNEEPKPAKPFAAADSVPKLIRNRA